jgi:hypothetical protein
MYPHYSLITLLAALMLAGCGTPYHPPHILEPDAHFPGLVDVLAAQPERQIDVLLVHGICTHDAAWADTAVARVTAALTAATAPARAAAVASSPLPDGEVAIVPAALDLPQGRIAFKSLIWSPLTQLLKRRLCFDQRDKSALCEGTAPYAPTRARLNALLKERLLDDCLADAVIYAGQARAAIQARMREAVLAATADQASSAPLLVVAESLGSKILFDTLLAMMDEESGPAAAAANRVVTRLRTLVMDANPIPLLALAEQPLPAASDAATLASPAAADSLHRLLQRRQQLARGGGAAPLLLLAFSDPNDVLSYTLAPRDYADQNVVVINILVSNANTWLGLLERPDTAHTGYLENADVGRLIACGQPASRLCAH